MQTSSVCRTKPQVPRSASDPKVYRQIFHKLQQLSIEYNFKKWKCQTATRSSLRQHQCAVNRSRLLGVVFVRNYPFSQYVWRNNWINFRKYFINSKVEFFCSAQRCPGGKTTVQLSVATFVCIDKWIDLFDLWCQQRNVKSLISNDCIENHFYANISKWKRVPTTRYCRPLQFIIPKRRFTSLWCRHRCVHSTGDFSVFRLMNRTILSRAIRLCVASVTGKLPTIRIRPTWAPTWSLNILK